ncbi:hypothetical protein CC80DRAFT_499479 [Byssothecium circinans]|uniref:Uncharacterized protein n=1 Tax=Byssothecium circinans TaxID=147558 RepID=A0A6A5UGZ4_9PLEO|nr:hypothetical protein CC80DRAFT_499479 [Byssothecium circinans]
MTWVHDLFAKLDVQFWPWPRKSRASDRPQFRSVYPQFTQLLPLACERDSNKTKVWTIQMPYISQENREIQMWISDIVKKMEDSYHSVWEPWYLRDSVARMRPPGKSRGRVVQDVLLGTIERFDSVHDRRRTNKGNEVQEAEETLYIGLKREGYRLRQLLHRSGIGRGLRRMLLQEDDGVRRRRHLGSTMSENLWERVVDSQPGLLPGIESYLFSDPLPLHPRRYITLATQSYYDMLEDTVSRDNDQVVTKWIQRKRCGQARSETDSTDSGFSEDVFKYFSMVSSMEGLRGLGDPSRKLRRGRQHHGLKVMVGKWTEKVLSGDLKPTPPSKRVRRERRSSKPCRGDRLVMVDQLWLWVIQDVNSETDSRCTIITSFPNCVGDNVEIDSQIGEREQITNVSDLLRLILARCVQEPTMEEEDPYGGTMLIEAFQGTIGYLEEKQSRKVSIRILGWLSHINFLSIGLIAKILQRKLYRSLVDHSGFYEDYIHHIIAEERYDSDDESSSSSDSSSSDEGYGWDRPYLDIDWHPKRHSTNF